jgi:hypothetical protein
LARTTIATPGFLDRFGDRVVVTDRTGGDLEVLRLRPELAADPAFETALKSRAEQLAGFQHRSVSRVRGVSRLAGGDGRLAVVSDVAKGWRLSEVLQAAEAEERLIHTSTVLFLLRQIAAVLTSLQASAPGISHGALGPERVVLTPAGRVLVVEYVFGAALEQLPVLPADRVWKEFRLAVPADGSTPRFGPHTDVLQLGIIALSLVHNRPLKRDEYPGRLVELLDSATESLLTGARQPIGRVLRDWLEHALGLVPSAPRWTMDDAQRGLEWIVSKEGGYFSTPVGLEPLLQSVDLFFTVPPASDADAVEPELSAVPVKPVVASMPSVPLAVPLAVPPAAPAAVRATPVSAMPPAPIAVPASRSSAAPALDAQPERHSSPAATTRLFTLVKPAEEAHVSLPPATELIARTIEAEDPDSANGGTTPADEPLLVTSSPLAEFAGERTIDELPEALEVPHDEPAVKPVPPPRPTPPPQAEKTAGPEVGPVADMLSVDRHSSRRRSGWNNEAWLSHSGERPQAGRVASASGPTPRTQKSGATPAASAAPAATEAPKSGPSPQPPDAPPADVRPAAPTAPARPATPPAPARAATPAAEPPAAAASTSLFGYSSADSSSSRSDEEESASGGSKRMLWIGIAAALILCVGGFAAWSAMKPAAPKPAASEPARESAGQPAKPPAATEAPRPTVETARAATPAPEPAAAPPAEARVATGTVQFVSTIVASVSEKGSAVGSTAAPVTLAAGRHTLDLSSDAYGYRAVREVDVRPGRLTRVDVALPKGSVNINATPWAEVFVDGQRVGETPLGNVQLTIGSHDVKFRHPQLGEQVRTVVVTAGTPGRLSVDMKQ